MEVPYKLKNLQLSTRRVVNLVRSQVYDTERPTYLVRRDTARRTGLSATDCQNSLALRLGSKSVRHLGLSLAISPPHLKPGA